MDTTKLITVLLVISLGILALSSYEMGQFNKMVPKATGAAVAYNAPVTNGPDVTPKGIPKIYGNELKVSYDDVSAGNPQKAESTISILGKLDAQITLTGKDLERYISITSKISCEYCCGTESIIFPNGQAACGCAHSYAMRGLAKYLIKNHNSEFTDDEILEELGKWKTLFFPGPMAKKAQVLQGKGIELNYINLASNKYRGIENGKQ